MTNNHPENQYLNLLKEVLDNGIKNTDRGTGAVSYSLFGKQCRYDLTKGFPLLTTKKIYWKGVLHELYWFLSGQSNISYLVKNNVHIWDDYPYKIYKEKLFKNKQTPLSKEEFIIKIKEDQQFAEKYGELPKIYGELWRRWPTKSSKTIDQLQWVLDELKADPDARNLIVNSWNPEYLYTMATPQKASRFPICHNMYQISQKNGRISLQLYQRSADLFLGVPFNIASYALLTHIIAKISGYEVGEFIHTLGDAHIYDNHIDQVQEQLQRQPKSLPKIEISDKCISLDSFTVDLVNLSNYEPHPTIKGDLTVAGGLFVNKNHVN